MALKLDFTIETKLSGVRLNRKVEAAMQGFVLQAAEEMIQDSMSMTPVGETGNLRDMQGAVSTGYLAAEARSDAPYSGFVDQGVRNSPAQPFFTPAYEKAKSTFERDAAEAARKAVGG